MNGKISPALIILISVLSLIPRLVTAEDIRLDAISDEETLRGNIGDTFTTKGAENPNQNFVNAVQTTWNGGPGVPGPVNDFGNRFDHATGIDYSNNGFITNTEGERFTRQNIVTMQVTLAYADIADFGGSSHFDYFLAFESNGSSHSFEIHEDGGSQWFGDYEHPEENHPVNHVAIADFNNDSANDFAVIVKEPGNYHLRLYRNTDSSAFEFDGRNSVFDFSDNGTINIDAGNYYNTGNRAGLIAADSESNRLDLFRDISGILVQQRNIGCTLNKPGPIASADFDDDGDVDFVCGSTIGGGIKWYSNNGLTNVDFTENTVASVGTVYDICASDIDRDGNPDIVVLISVGSYHYLAWYRYDGSSSGFETGVSISSDYTYTGKSRIASAPLTSDIAPDVCLTLNDGSDSEYKVIYFENDGSGNFPNEYIITDGNQYPEPVSVEFGNYDNDNLNDLITCSADFDGSGHGSTDAFIRATSAYNEGELVSSVYNTYQGGDETIYGEISYTLSGDSNPDYCEVYCRGSHNQDMSGSTWQGPLENGDYLGNYQGFYNEEQYIQYRIVLNAPSATDLPVRFQEFSIEYDPSGAPGVPRISHTSPAHEESDVVLNSNVIIYFTEPMNENTLNVNNIKLRHATNELPWAGAYEEGSEEYIFTLDPANNFSSNATIFLEVSPSVLGADGTPLDTDGDGQPGGAPFQIWFYTGTSIDDIPPTISEKTATPNPIGGASEVIITALYSDTDDPGNATIVGGSCYIAEPYTVFEIIPSDGAFDEPTENVSVTIPVGSLPQGDAIDVNITALDSAGNESAPEILTLVRGSAKFLDKKTVFAYPNPCYDDTVSFYFYVTKDSDAAIAIYDLKGRLLGKKSGRADGSDPDNHFDWNAANIAPGVYVFTVQATADDGTTGTVRKKFALLR